MSIIHNLSFGPKFGGGGGGAGSGEGGGGEKSWLRWQFNLAGSCGKLYFLDCYIIYV